MNAAAVICLGNRFAASDATGCRVHDHLLACDLPPGIDLFDGGLCGLDLLRLIDGRQRVVFVDALAGMAPPGTIAVLEHDLVATFAKRYGHGAGLPYLLGILPKLHEGPLPEIAVVGAEGVLDDAGITALAECCLKVAANGTT